MPKNKKRIMSQWWLLVIVSGILGLVLYTLKDPVEFTSVSQNVGHVLGHMFFWAVTVPIVIYVIVLIPCGIYWLVTRNVMPHYKILLWVLFSVFALVQAAAVIDEKKLGSNRYVKQSQISTSDIFKNAKDSIFAVYVYEAKSNKRVGYGTAVAVGEKLLATNCHVALASDYFTVVVDDNNKEVKGDVYSQHGDLCIVSVPGQTFKPVDIRYSNEVEVGEDVYAIGNPEELEKSITKGILSKKHTSGSRFLQTDAVIAGGSSGGGLFDGGGKLIGITTATHKEADGVTFAIPSEVILAAVLEPVSASTNNTKSVSTEESAPTLSEIGTYGKDEVGLYSMGNTCFMVFKGRDPAGKVLSLVIWLPAAPERFFVFPFAKKLPDAMSYMGDFVSSDGEMIRTKDFIILDDKGYPLFMDKTIKGYNKVKMAVLDFNPIKLLIDGNYFLVEFSDPEAPEGFVRDYYGLYGFTDSLADFHTHCGKKN